MSAVGSSDEATRPRSPESAIGSPRITLISKPGCHLCVLAKEVVSRVAEDLGVSWEVQDITELPDPDPMWWEQIPVTLVDGQVHDYWRVNERRLREALTAPSRPA